MLNKNLTRKDLANKINKSLGLSKSLSLQIIEDFFELITSEIIKTKKIKITSFGTFSVLDKKERIGRNPKTKVEAKILSRKTVKFKPSLILKNKMNKNE